VRVLLHVKPLLDLRASDSRVAENGRHYDSLVIALRIFDLILESSGFDRGIDQDGIRRAVTPLLVAMDRQAGLAPDADRHVGVVTRVLGSLLNDAAGRSKFAAEYVDIRPDGAAETVRFYYRLVEEHYRETDGEIELRLTPEAVNLYLGSLDRDIEDEQIATEALIQAQLARGSFQKARRSADDAHTQSWLYTQKIRDVLNVTRRDLRQVDWQQTVPALLGEARAHINARLAAERAILASAGEQIEVLVPGSDEARHVAEITALVRRCFERHSELSQELLRARTTFLDEQARQSFPLAAARSRKSFNSDILTPVLALPVRGAVVVADIARRILSAPLPTRFLDLEQLVEWQLRPRREQPPAGVLVFDRHLTDLPPQIRRFPADVRDTADRELMKAARDHRSLDMVLSGLVAGRADPAVIECLILRALQAYGQIPAPRMPLPIRAVKMPGRIEVAGIFGDNVGIELLALGDRT
jgi:hypothetical protein